MHRRGNGEKRPIGYLITDIEDSTPKWYRTPEAMELAQARCNGLIVGIIERCGGEIQGYAGDEVCAIFRAGDPLECALEIQRAVQAENWETVGGLSVRIGVHCAWDASHGAGKACAARIAASACGGQIVVSAGAAHAFGLPAGAELADLGVCRLRGVDEPIQLCGLLHPDLARREFPPLRLPLTGGALPASRPLYGREEELAEILGKMDGAMRQLTIVGPGGNGKTRLANEVARTLSKTDAVYCVSLEGAADASDIAVALAGALHFPFYGPKPREEQLIAYLSDKRPVILFDNADRLAGKCAFLGAILLACPAVRIFVTSREPIMFEGENIFRLQGLKIPPRGDPAFRSAPACVLFVQEARASDPEFEFEDGDAAVFGEICEMLGGSPLALHLAAQWTALLSLNEIHARLRGGVSFLAALGGNLEGAFEGSWALLGDDQRRALARLSVFDGGFDKEAADFAAGADVADIAILERKSLIERRGRRRFALHPLIREYAQARLARWPGGLLGETRRLHSEYFLDLVRRCYVEGRGVEQGRMLDRVETELANVRAAWTFAVDAGDAHRLCEAAEPVFYTFAHRALFYEGACLFDAPVEDAGLRAHFLGLRANCLVHQGAYPAAEEIAGRALGEAACEPIAAAHCRHALGAIAHARRERSAARLHYEWALAERRRLADSMGAYYSAMSLAFLELESDNLTKAREYANESSRLCHATGHLGGMLSVHACTGGIAAKEGRQSAALESYRQAVEVEETVRHPQLKAATFVKLGEIYSSRSQFDRACASYGEALELADAVGDARIAINARVGLGRSLRLRGEAERAKSVLRTALKQALALASHAQLADALSEFASVARGMGDYRTPARIADTLRALRLDQMKSEALALMAEFVGPRPPPEAHVETEVLELINEPEFGVVHL